ncbi:MAG: squalene synthase HpnC [Burkholderiales bacterium]
MGVDHYENFPVASVLLPRHLRRPVELIYRFAREADDFADEGELAPAVRLERLDAFSRQLRKIEAGEAPDIAWFGALAQVIREHGLPLEAFHDLLSAFRQDVTRDRYATFGDVLDYCRRSANPVGRLLLVLYGARKAQYIEWSDSICSSLQLINFLQDVAIDYGKNRIYLPLDEMAHFGVSEEDIAIGTAGARWEALMRFQIERARAMLDSGSPLGRALTGRLGLEMRMIIAGGSRILDKIEAVRGDVFRRRPVLRPRDWPIMLVHALRARGAASHSMAPLR